MARRLTWYEFFAGGGMARLGLGKTWRCLFANEWCVKKAAAYSSRFGRDELKIADIATLTAADLPGRADLAWASFPCQDLSLAGSGAGLKGQRSGTFHFFWDLMEALASEGRAPRAVAIENVAGAITSHGGADFAAILGRMAATGYHFGPMIVDAVHFVPQSRPRLFVIAVREGDFRPSAIDGLRCGAASGFCHPASLQKARVRLPGDLRRRWIWWKLPLPPARRSTLLGLLDDEPRGVRWHSAAQTEHLLSLMSDRNRRKLREAGAAGARAVGTIYRRTRNGTQRAEVRFDGISGCLRTPAGGSSRQIILVIEGGDPRSRLLAPREAARLMGVPEDYPIPARYNDAYHLFGDGLAVPAVRHLAEHLLEPLLSGRA